MGKQKSSAKLVSKSTFKNGAAFTKKNEETSDSSEEESSSDEEEVSSNKTTPLSPISNGFFSNHISVYLVNLKLLSTCIELIEKFPTMVPSFIISFSSYLMFSSYVYECHWQEDMGSIL